MMTALAVATTHPVLSDPTLMLTWATLVVTIIAACIAVARWGRKYGRKIMQMVEDFNGTGERPGVPARLGVMERLQGLDLQVAQVISETSPNHGGSMKDAVQRIDTKVGTLEIDVKGIHERMDLTGPQKVVEVNVHP